ncbi:MAG TPA: hypothetical protein VGQ37_06215 [Vicinamibacterales bacterium]|jgi:hypothetical protein|nr:hypothetical protein [Vicinamibacterales bacterium]
MATDKTEEFQKQTLELLRSQQEAYLAAVKAWREAMSAGAAQAPAWPTFPNAEMLPTPAEVAEASYAFAAKLLADQSRFMQELSRAMALPPDKKG